MGQDETLDIALDEGPHTITVNQPFSKKVPVAVKQEEAYVIKGNPWHLIIRLMATTIVFFVSLSLFFPIQMSFGLALIVMILAVLINVVNLFFIRLYRIELM
jgi:hypothetical protein